MEEAIEETIGRAELNDIIRQKDQWARKAVKDIADGEAANVLSTKQTDKPDKIPKKPIKMGTGVTGVEL